jgi:hypothetical protein
VDDACLQCLPVRVPWLLWWQSSDSQDPVWLIAHYADAPTKLSQDSVFFQRANKKSYCAQYEFSLIQQLSVLRDLGSEVVLPKMVVFESSVGFYVVLRQVVFDHVRLVKRRYNLLCEVFCCRISMC